MHRRDQEIRSTSSRRRGLRGGPPGGVGYHAGAGRRRPDDGRDADAQHRSVVHGGRQQAVEHVLEY